MTYSWKNDLENSQISQNQMENIWEIILIFLESIKKFLINSTIH